MKTIKISTIMVFIIISLMIVGCSTMGEIDFIAGESLYEIDDDEIEVTYIDRNNDGYSEKKYKEELLEQLKEYKNLDMEIEKIKTYGDNIGVTIRFSSIEDFSRVSEIEIFNDTLDNYLDNNNISYDGFEDKDLLYHVLNGSKINEEQIKKYKKYKLLNLYCGSSKVKVDGEILFASKQGEIISKDIIYFTDYDNYYILYKPSSGTKQWVLWALLILVIVYAVYLSIKWQSNKKEDKICLYCGQKNDDDAIYCKICGNKIINENE